MAYLQSAVCPGAPSISCLITIYLSLSILHLSAHSSNPLSCLSTLDRLLNDCFRNGNRLKLQAEPFRSKAKLRAIIKEFFKPREDPQKFL